MMKFEQSNARTSDYVNPSSIKEPSYRTIYKKMARRCAFPAGYGNGLFLMAIGLVICIAGFASMFLGRTSPYRAFIFGGGIVLGLIAAYIYCSYMQTAVIFPRGGSMRAPKPAPMILKIVPPLILIGIAAWTTVQGLIIAPMVITGTVIALFIIYGYARSGRNSMLILALIVQAIPMGMGYLGYVSLDPFTSVLTVLPYQGLVTVMLGVFHVQTVVVPGANRHDRERLRSYLASDNPRKRFMAAAFLSNSLDPELLPEIITCCMDNDRTVAYTAQVALGNTWGPKPRELFIPIETMVANLPSEYREQYVQEAEKRCGILREKWAEHHKAVEAKVVEMAQEGGDTLENLFSLAAGTNILYDKARTFAIESLGSMRTPRAYATLMNLLQHRSKKVAKAAIAGFYGADSKAVLYLEKFFAGATSWVRRRAIRATRSMLDYLLTFDEAEADVAYALLENDIDGLFDIDDTCTFAATISLLSADEPEDVEILEGYCENERPLVKIEALASLTKLCPDAAKQRVIGAMSDFSAPVRYAAILCAEKLMLPNNGELFARMLQDRNPRVAQLAGQAAARHQQVMRPRSPWL